MEEGKPGAETFLKELVWREFAYHLMHHTPGILTNNWKEDWDAFPWAADGCSTKVQRWIQGRTGIRFVDAAMREMYVTGRMHNRGRMIVASYLTKHLLTHWKIGLKWFEDCLIDWDPASNALGWQWTAGSGHDAAPYFRIFNPVLQGERYDPDGEYVRRWVPELKDVPKKFVHKPWEAPSDVLARAGVKLGETYPKPLMDHSKARDRALAAYQKIK